MTLSKKGAALVLAALVSVVPVTAVAEILPVGAPAALPSQGTTMQTTNVLLAMLASPAPLGGKDAPLSSGLQKICHRSTGGCDGSATNELSVPTLSFPSARGQVIFEHHWSSGDIPSSFETPGGGKAATRFADGKFRLATSADGRYKIVTDSETGAEVLDILVTRADEARTKTHHTEVEVNIPDYWTKGRFMIPGQRYLLEYWRKNIDYTPDTEWEIWWQNHSMYDSSAEKSRNPSVAIEGGRSGEVLLRIRADSKALSYKKNGRWTYTRDSKYDLGTNSSSSWELWQMEIKVDSTSGALHLWRNGSLVHSEEGLPVGYNDKNGPPWSFGWYKYFGRSSVDRRQAYIGPVRVQKL
ncbi:MAG TPA: heparin lyase I family protein [Kiloniellaceae bacterium]|nr:heparin lyase I family protein [Kiloniellaceae bacterium]